MDDLISRQAAVDALGERPVIWSDNDEYTLGERNQYDMDRLAIETVPSAQPSVSKEEMVGDVISRQAAIDAVRKALDRETLLNSFVRKVAIDAVKVLPSAQQIPWDANTRNSMVFTLRTVANHGDMDAIDEDNIKRLSRWLEGEEP